MASSERVVRIFPDATALNRAAAETFAARTDAAVQARGVSTVALAGGSTPRALYGLLAGDASFRARIPWGGTHFFWGDERHVPADDPASNYRMAHEAMLSRVPVPAANVHRIPTENPDAAAAADAYERELRDFFTVRGLMREGFPRFDLVLLGMGADGHTASLFPGTAAVHETNRMVTASWVPKLRSHRVTLTPPVLSNAAAVIFLVSGEEKAETLRAVLEGEWLPAVHPSQAIRPEQGALLWLVDRAAGRLLRP
ncbi:MAG: 6-phosphogluconolactonase [Candidatus Rokubacteria bacterium]|nr:6-phosphogluconolactonase [Candidatus Rokubacteria bacterium]